MPRPTRRHTDPVIVVKPRARERNAESLPSLVVPAPGLRRCMACLTLRAATPEGVVLWHADAVDAAHDCAGAGAPGIPVCAHCWRPLTGSTGVLEDGSVVCHTGTVPGDEGPPDCYRLVTVYGETLGSRRAA